MKSARQVYRSVSVNPPPPMTLARPGVSNLTVAVASLTVGFVPTKGLRWSESQHNVSPLPRARGGDRDGMVAGASGSLPNPNTNLNPNPVWSRQRELLMHLLPWCTAAAAAAQAQPGNNPTCPGLSSFPQETASSQLSCMP